MLNVYLCGVERHQIAPPQKSLIVHDQIAYAPLGRIDDDAVKAANRAVLAMSDLNLVEILQRSADLRGVEIAQLGRLGRTVRGGLMHRSFRGKSYASQCRSQGFRPELSRPTMQPSLNAKE